MQNDTKQTGEKISSFAVNNIPHSEWEKLAILACAGMADPAAEIQAMREARREAVEKALAKLQPFCIIGWRYAETLQPSEPATNEQEKRLESILATIREVHATLKTTLGYAEQDSIAIHSSVEKLEKYL